MTQWRETAAVATCVLLAVLAPGLRSAAQVYKWVDEKGTVHFSNDPPAKAAVEELPETEHRPRVENGPPGPEESEAEVPDVRATHESRRGAASDHEAEDVGSSELIVDESDTIIVEDGLGDPVTRYRANSPRNRPGQPIREPIRQPNRQPRRGR